jgi:hypothetical protein
MGPFDLHQGKPVETSVCICSHAGHFGHDGLVFVIRKEKFVDVFLVDVLDMLHDYTQGLRLHCTLPVPYRREGTSLLMRWCFPRSCQ